MNETVSGHPDEWLPIRPGTDAALVAGIAHEWIVNGQVNKEFLDKYAVGYDDDTMPESAKGQNKSYKDYVIGHWLRYGRKESRMGCGHYANSRRYHSPIGGRLGCRKSSVCVPGLGPQRHTNSEDTTRAICMLPILLGQIGLPGTNTGQREAWNRP